MCVVGSVNTAGATFWMLGRQGVNGPCSKCQPWKGGAVEVGQGLVDKDKAGAVDA